MSFHFADNRPETALDDLIGAWASDPTIHTRPDDDDRSPVRPMWRRPRRVCRRCGGWGGHDPMCDAQGA